MASLVFLFYFLVLNAITITDLRELITVHLLPDTPVVVLLIMIIGLCVLAAKNGLECIARMSEWIFPIIMLIILVDVIALSDDLDFTQMQPFLQQGWVPVFEASFLLLILSVLFFWFCL